MSFDIIPWTEELKKNLSDVENASKPAASGMQWDEPRELFIFYSLMLVIFWCLAGGGQSDNLNTCFITLPRPSGPVGLGILGPYSIVCMVYTRYIPTIHQKPTYARYIDLAAAAYDTFLPKAIFLLFSMHLSSSCPLLR
jgi:hypothetical protein